MSHRQVSSWRQRGEDGTVLPPNARPLEVTGASDVSGRKQLGSDTLRRATADTKDPEETSPQSPSDLETPGLPPLAQLPFCPCPNSIFIYFVLETGSLELAM